MEEHKFFLFIKTLISIITSINILSTEAVLFLYIFVSIILVLKATFYIKYQSFINIHQQKKEYSNDMYHSNIPLVYPRYVIKSLTKYA